MRPRHQLSSLLCLHKPGQPRRFSECQLAHQTKLRFDAHQSIFQALPADARANPMPGNQFNPLGSDRNSAGSHQTAGLNAAESEVLCNGDKGKTQQNFSPKS